MTLEQISALLRQVTDEVQKLEQESKTNIEDTDDHQLTALAKRYPFKGHILTLKSDIVKKYYITTLFSLISHVKNQETVKKQRLYIGRIIASYDIQVAMKDYIAQSLKLDQKHLCNLPDMFDSETSFCFAVDLIALYMMAAEEVGKKEFEAVSDLLQLLGMNKWFIAKAMNISKSIVEQDFTQLLQQIEPSETRNYDCFLGYYPENKYTSITTDFTNIQNLPGNVLLANAWISQESEYMELDQWAAEELTFYNCSFKKIRGIKGDKKPVTFDSCKFTYNYFLTKERMGILGRTSSVENEYVFIQGKSIRLINTIFSGIRTSKHVLDITNGEIIDCKFINCKGLNSWDSYMIQINNGKIESSLFENCAIENIENILEVAERLGKVIDIKNGIVKAINSNIQYCHFEKCYLGYSAVFGNQKNSYILGLRNSVEQNNEFNQCYVCYDKDEKKQQNCNVGQI